MAIVTIKNAASSAIRILPPLPRIGANHFAHRGRAWLEITLSIMILSGQGPARVIAADTSIAASTMTRSQRYGWSSSRIRRTIATLFFLRGDDRSAYPEPDVCIRTQRLRPREPHRDQRARNCDHGNRQDAAAAR